MKLSLSIETTPNPTIGGQDIPIGRVAACYQSFAGDVSVHWLLRLSHDTFLFYDGTVWQLQHFAKYAYPKYHLLPEGTKITITT